MEQARELEKYDPLFSIGELKLTQEVMVMLRKGDEHLERMAAAPDVDELKHHAMEAEKAYLEALRLSRNGLKNKILLYGLGMVRLKQRKTLLALSSFSEAAELDPDYTPAHYGEAECLRELRRYSQAIVSYTKVLGTCEKYYGGFPEETLKAHWDPEPYVAEVLYKRAVCYMEMADHDMARSDCKRVVDSNVENRWRVMAMVRLAKLDTIDTKFGPALAWCNKALQVDPKSIDAYSQRAQVNTLWRKVEDGEADFKKAELLKREKLWTRQHVPK